MVVREEERIFFVHYVVPENTQKKTSHTSYSKLKDNKHNSLYYAPKHALVFLLRHYLFLEVYNFPRISLSENCSSADKYPCIFLHRIEATVSIALTKVFSEISYQQLALYLGAQDS